MNAIVIVVDRLHLGYLGAYGSARVATPAIDRLAAEGFVFDQAYVESPEWERLYAAYWQGRHAMCPPPKAPGAGLIDCLSDGPVTAKLLTDDRQLADSSLARSFRETVFLDLPERDQPAATVDETRLASCFAAAIELVESTPSPFLLWCHLRGLSAPWDAPREFQLACHDEGDPEPSDSVAVPNLFLPPGYDPDELLAYDQAYAGQVALLDACFEAFLEGIENDPGKQSTLILTSARGFPMGEHSRVGACDRALYSELVHVPLLVRLPDGTGAADRSQALVEPVDLYSTLSDCLGVRCEPSLQGSSLLPILRGDTERIRDRVTIVGPGVERAIVTPAWYMRQKPPAELFLHPEDRWEASDVANRRSDVVETLTTTLAEDERFIQSSQPSSPLPLEPWLCVPSE